jgi:hypothetical protein
VPADPTLESLKAGLASTKGTKPFVNLAGMIKSALQEVPGLPVPA